jgi:hypothetical protein
MGYPIFHLEFHLPYFAFRESTSQPKHHCEFGAGGKLRRTWRNLSFLQHTQSKNSGQTLIGIHDAQISLGICGSDHTRWVCYAFVDTKFDEALTSKRDDKSEDHQEEQDEDDITEDPIAPDSEGHAIIADTPVYDPRGYFLRILDLRMRQILKEWTYLMKKVEDSVERYV